jgi:hypothetical protein
MGRIEMVAVGPHATGFNVAPHAPCAIDIQRPQPGPQSIFRVVRDTQRFRFIFKGGDPITGPKISSWKQRIWFSPLINVG